MSETQVTDTPPDVVETGDREQTVRERFGDASGNVLRPTATDALGIDRVVGPPVTDWTPAQVEPDADDVAAHEEFLARRAESREAQLDALTNPSLVDETAQPLIEANREREAEHEDALKAKDDAKQEQAKPAKQAEAKPATPAGEQK